MSTEVPSDAPIAGRPIGDRTLSDRVYENVFAMILNNQIPVGAKLPTEQVLSQQFEVSRPVLRQALKQLREDGVIVSRQGSGSYVKRKPESKMLDFAPVGSIADIQRTFEFRIVIEGEAAFFAAKRRSEEDLQCIKEALKALGECVRKGTLGVDEDENFHVAVCAASDNYFFSTARTSLKSNIVTSIKVSRNLSLTKPQDRLELVQAEHYKIYEAIKNQDAKGARKAMRGHIKSARKRIFEGKPKTS